MSGTGSETLLIDLRRVFARKSLLILRTVFSREVPSRPFVSCKNYAHAGT